MFYNGSGLQEQNPANCTEIRRLITALVKSGTTSPMQKSSVRPVAPCVSLFEQWGDNAQLDTKKLRLKAIVLPALAVMARPSDLAPKAVLFNGKEEQQVLLSRDQVSFLPDGSMSIKLLGTKNDTQRKGHEIVLPPASNKVMDPAQCLMVYIERTTLERQIAPGCPLFVTLNKPYKAISAKTVADVLSQGIQLAGLDGQGFSAKSFRPTAATVAVESWCNPEIAQQVGRWASPAVFFEHYVHSKPPPDFLDKLFIPT